MHFSLNLSFPTVVFFLWKNPTPLHHSVFNFHIFSLKLGVLIWGSHCAVSEALFMPWCSWSSHSPRILESQWDKSCCSEEGVWAGCPAQRTKSCRKRIGTAILKWPKKYFKFWFFTPKNSNLYTACFNGGKKKNPWLRLSCALNSDI